MTESLEEVLLSNIADSLMCSRKMSNNLASLFGVFLLLVSLACDSEKGRNESGETKSTTIKLEESSLDRGLDFVHYNGMNGSFKMPEIMGSGAAFFDYDRDGDLDLFMIQGNRLDEDVPFSSSIFVPKDTLDIQDQLFKNLYSESGVLEFTNVTKESGIDSRGYGMGVAAGDLDNDGNVDLVVSNLGENQIFMNRGEGKFQELRDSGLEGYSEWSTAISLIDLNRDGFLDIYVGNYLDYFRNPNKECFDQSGRLDYCGPLSFFPQDDQVFLSQEGRSFSEDTSILDASSIKASATLGSARIDLGGSSGLYIANDSFENFLLLSNSKGRLLDEGSKRGAAVNQFGKKEGSMGIAIADIDNDLDEDIFVTHWKEETNTLYRDSGEGNYFDETAFFKLAIPSRNSTGFGTLWLDVDYSGTLDLFVANGSIRRLAVEGDPFPLKEKNQFFLSSGPTFSELDELPFSEKMGVSRAALKGDLDNDGDLDVLVTNNSGRPELFINMSEPSNWIGFDVRDTIGNPLNYFKVEMELDSGEKMMRVGRRDGSYLSSSDPRVLFYLPEGVGIEKLTIVNDGQVLKLDENSVDMRGYNEIVFE